VPPPAPCKWRGPVLINHRLGPQREYKGMVYVGRVPSRMNLKSNDKPYHTVYSRHLHRLTSPYISLLKDIAGDVFCMVEPCLENVDATISSFDDPQYGEFRDKFFYFGMGFMDYEYGGIFHDCIATDEELSHYIDYTKSAGYTPTFWKIRSKGELFADENYKKSDYNLAPEKTRPLTSVANKKEPKYKEDVKKNKIRLFFISEAHLCKEQVRFGKRSSIRLIEYKWSAYGFSPFRGGVDRLARKLLINRIRFYYDLSGWDKYIPIMGDLYQIIQARTNCPNFLLGRFTWMMDHTTGFYCVMWNGDVVWKGYGNCSGSGTTTRDNILMHVILAAAFLCQAYFEKMGVMPTYDLLTRQIAKLFGDDSVFSVEEEFDKVVEDGWLNAFFVRCGMKLKFLHGGLDYPVEKMEFLGFRFTMIDGTYYPYYDPVRLAYSYLATNDKEDTLEAYVSKCFVLTMMAFATEARDTFLNAYRHLVLSLHGDLSPTLKSFSDIGPLTVPILKAFYSGAESSSIDFSFFESILEEVGRKETLLSHHGDICKTQSE